MTNHHSLETPLWAYANNLWRKPDAQTLLLRLQDQYSLRVNLLMLACWAGSLGHQFKPQELITIANKTHQRHEKTVKTLRTVKRGLAKDPLHEPLRNALHEAELQAEKLELFELFNDAACDCLPTATTTLSEQATVSNLAVLFESAPSRLNTPLLVQLSRLALNSLSEQHVNELIKRLQTP